MNKSTLTFADVLELPELMGADAVVLTGAKYISAAVRGTFVAKIIPSVRKVRQGDLVLAAGRELPASSAEMLAFVRGISSAGAAGLIIEQDPETVPFTTVILEEFERAHLPVAAANRPISFIAVVQAVTDRLIDNHSAELISASRIHTVFTELSYADANREEVLQAAQRLSGTDIAIENSDHQLLDYLCATEDEFRFMGNWEVRSRSVPTQDRPIWNQALGWFVAPIGSPSKGLGRLIFASPTEPSSALTAIAERAATVLMIRMQGKEAKESIVRRQHHNVLAELLSNPSSLDLCRRTWRAGMPSRDRKYVGVLIRPLGKAVSEAALSDSMHAIVTTCQRIAAAACFDCIVAAFDTDVRMLLGMPPTVDEISAVDEFAGQVHAKHSVIVAAGTSVNTFQTIDRTLREALNVMSAMASSASSYGVCRLTSIHVRGLLTLLIEDDRMISFTERELAPLIAAGKTLSYDIFDTVRVLIENWESKSQAASKLFVSRPVLYERIRKIESIIGASMEDVEIRTSLHLALLSYELGACKNSNKIN